MMSHYCRCPGRNHETYGQCLRAKNIRVAYCQSAKNHDRTMRKNWDSELELYRNTRKQGIQPATTKTRDIRNALDISDKTGRAYDANTYAYNL